MQKTAAKVSVTTTKVSLTGLSSAHDAVMVHSAPVDEGMATVAGCMYEGDKAITAFDLISSFETSGFQATHLGRAARIIKNMLSWRLVQEDLTDEEQNELHADGWKPPFSWAVPE
ncbi:putative deoxyhypusine synthase, partial [Gregarina niphandrodes]